MILKKRKNAGKTLKSEKGQLSRTYEEYLFEDLKDPQEAAAYLTATLEEEDPEVFLLALKDVASVYGGIGKLSAQTSLNRRSLYRMLSEKGNPGLYSLERVLKALGFHLAIKAS